MEVGGVGRLGASIIVGRILVILMINVPSRVFLAASDRNPKLSLA